MVPQLLLGDVVGEVCEIEGRNILVVPPFFSSVVMLTPFPFSGECPSGILTKPHSVSLDSLATIPISLPPSVSLYSLSYFSTFGGVEALFSLFP